MYELPLFGRRTVYLTNLSFRSGMYALFVCASWCLYGFGGNHIQRLIESRNTWAHSQMARYCGRNLFSYSYEIIFHAKTYSGLLFLLWSTIFICVFSINERVVCVWAAWIYPFGYNHLDISRANACLLRFIAQQWLAGYSHWDISRWVTANPNLFILCVSELNLQSGISHHLINYYRTF